LLLALAIGAGGCASAPTTPDNPDKCGPNKPAPCVIAEVSPVQLIAGGGNIAAVTSGNPRSVQWISEADLSSSIDKPAFVGTEATPFAVDSSSVYALGPAGNSLVVQPKGGSARVLARRDQQAWLAGALSTNDVWLAGLGLGAPKKSVELWRVSRVTGTSEQVTTIATKFMPFTIFDFADAIAVGGDDVFVASGDGIYVLRGGNAPPVLLTAEPLTVNTIKVDATYVWWRTGISNSFTFCMFTCPPLPPRPASFLRRVPRAGGVVETVATDVGAFAVFGDHLYGVSGSSILRIGGSNDSVTIATIPMGIEQLVVDASGVYFVSRSRVAHGAEIWRADLERR